MHDDDNDDDDGGDDDGDGDDDAYTSNLPICWSCLASTNQCRLDTGVILDTYPELRWTMRKPHSRRGQYPIRPRLKIMATKSDSQVPHIRPTPDDCQECLAVGSNMPDGRTPDYRCSTYSTNAACDNLLCTQYRMYVQYVENVRTYVCTLCTVCTVCT